MEKHNMKYASFAVGAVIVVLGAACAPAAVTPDPAQIQASAVAAAGTMIAQTQAAVPTSTAIPPSPQPSPTPFPLPTLDLLPSLPPPTATVTGGDDCNHLFDFAASGGAHTPVKFINVSSGPVHLSISMNEKNAFGQCGYFGTGNIAKGGSMIISMPSTQNGPCWWSFGWQTGSKPSTPEGGPWCLKGTDKYTVEIGNDSMKLIPP